MLIFTSRPAIPLALPKVHGGAGTFPVRCAPLWPHQHPSEFRVLVFPYLNDWLLKVGLPQAVVTHLQTMANLLHSLGFTINVPKSHLAPSQMLPFIRAILDTV